MNLLDTPGHRDFSEDTYRVLSAVDAVVMVLDAAKGIESQTLKLFQVCRSRNLPVITFLNKYDRPGREPLELLDEIEEQIKLRPTPVTWPVGSGDEFQGLVDRRTRPATPVHPHRTRRVGGARRVESDLHEPQSTRRGRVAPVWKTPSTRSACSTRSAPTSTCRRSSPANRRPLFVGSALTNFGVRTLLDAVVELAPPPSPRRRSRRRAAPARLAVQRVRVQGAGQHGPVAPRPHRLRPHLLGPLRARHVASPTRAPAAT